MQHSNNLNCFGIPFFVIDDSKNILSFNIETSYNIKLLFLRKPKIGQPIGEVFAEEDAVNICGLVDKCLDGNPVIVEGPLLNRIVNSAIKLQIIFIPIYIKANLTYAVCLILPDLYSSNKALLSKRQSKFISHKLHTPVNSFLSLSDLKNHATLSTYDDQKIEELLADFRAQAEKIDEMIITLNFLFNVREGGRNAVNRMAPIDHIVLVDDDPLINMIHKILLLKYKKDALVKGFENPLLALNYITETRPDLIFLDINMPEMNAWEFLDKLEETAFNTPVIVISSSIDANERLKAYSHKCVKEFISKPLTYEKLTSLFIS